MFKFFAQIDYSFELFSIIIYHTVGEPQTKQPNSKISSNLYSFMYEWFTSQLGINAHPLLNLLLGGSWLVYNVLIPILY